jgi:hypothetical protein
MNLINLNKQQKNGWLSILMGLVLFATFTLGACASNLATANCPVTNRVSQSFSFDVFDNPEIEILDYFYGTPNCPSLYSNDDQRRGEGHKLVSINLSGPLFLAQKLYVKWRINSTGQVLEDTVDLRQRLPKDMSRQRLHFIVRNTQLYVFVVTPEFRAKDDPQDDGPLLYKSHKILTVYPDQSK